ncbi:uncharacterized protein LOC127239646 [Andrographis paniculata]|uniref:uncharacterized protein LOC127239646 n=1 Tax=Andrographis paniculata TaxID=175694 RepID=UPI0021E727B9|nr:uncharacterized protein LOC127239646 [Andrographis paniculata]
MNTAAAGSNTVPSQSGPGLKTHFKSPEGKYKLLYEKTFPIDIVPNDSHSKSVNDARLKTVTQGTLACLKDKPTAAPLQSSSSFGMTSGVRSAAARFLGSGSGNKVLSFGANGGSKFMNGNQMRPQGSLTNGSNDGRGNYLVFNVGDLIYISDLSSSDKDPIKSIHFGNMYPICHAYDHDAKDGLDLIIGLNSGDVYLMSLRQQLQDVAKRPVGALHYNKEGYISNSCCTCIKWIPNADGSFVVAHADGNMYVYDKNKDVSLDPSFPMIKDPTEFSVTPARHNKNPVARWHIGQGSINDIAFTVDGSYMATVGRDGYLRVFNYKTEQLICGGKSYYGALLCCAWSMDGKYIVAGGEDDLVQVWSMEDRKFVACGEGHNSWVSEVAFDPYWTATNANSDGMEENTVYRFGSVGQDARLLLWDLEIGELVVPVRRAACGSPSFSKSALRSDGILQRAPSIRDLPRLAPLVAHRVDTEPLSGLIFMQESVITVGRDRHAKVWARPGFGENQPSTNSI